MESKWSLERLSNDPLSQESEFFPLWRFSGVDRYFTHYFAQRAVSLTFSSGYGSSHHLSREAVVEVSYSPNSVVPHITLNYSSSISSNTVRIARQPLTVENYSLVLQDQVDAFFAPAAVERYLESLNVPVEPGFMELRDEILSRRPADYGVILAARNAIAAISEVSTEVLCSWQTKHARSRWRQPMYHQITS